jgi:arylsulfatase A-like enzyme
VSLPGYTEIFAGQAPTRCQDNECGGARTPTIADEIRARVARNSDVAVFASWERIGAAATAEPWRIVVSAGRTDVRESVDPYPGYGAFRPDRYTAALALRYLDSQRPAFLFVGLGEPDEYAHRGDYAGYLASLRFADDFIGRLLATLDRMGERGRRTLVLITSDHGRARDYRDHGGQFPESARVWLAAFGGPVRARGFAAAPETRHLADVAPTIRAALAMKSNDEQSSGMPLLELLDDADPVTRIASSAPLP